MRACILHCLPQALIHKAEAQIDATLSRQIASKPSLEKEFKEIFEKFKEKSEDIRQLQVLSYVKKKEIKELVPGDLVTLMGVLNAWGDGFNGGGGPAPAPESKKKRGVDSIIKDKQTESHDEFYKRF